MVVDLQKRQVINEFFRLIALGPTRGHAIVDLFSSNAILIEPFMGATRTHEGSSSVNAAIRRMWRDDFPQGTSFGVDRITLDFYRLRAEWRLTSPEFAAEMRGLSWFAIRDGKITELELTVTEIPEFSPALG